MSSTSAVVRTTSSVSSFTTSLKVLLAEFLPKMTTVTDTPRRSPRRHFTRWVVEPGDTLAAILAEIPTRSGVYIIEFANGERYVGETENIQTRFATHVLRSGQHAPWKDAVALQFWPLPRFSRVERQVEERKLIEELRAQGHTLRNRTWNLYSTQPGTLDGTLDADTFEHWAAGTIDHAIRRDWHEPDAVLERCIRDGSKLMRNTAAVPGLYGAIIDDVASVLHRTIPMPVTLEAKRWTLSDFPSTSGGRFVTLNVGRLEVYFAPREWDDPWVVLNAALGTVQKIKRERQLKELDAEANSRAYKGHPVDQFAFGAGEVAEAFDRSPALLEGVRRLTMQLMRRETSGLFARHHSEVLATEVFRYMHVSYFDGDTSG